MECASIFMENSESSPNCISFKFKHFLSSPQSSLELSCFYYFFLIECAFLILNVHNTKQSPYLQHKRTTGHHLCTVRHFDCWRVYILKYCSFVSFISGKYKYCLELFLWRCWFQLWQINYFGDASHVWPQECINPLILSIYTHFLQTGINTKHTLLSHKHILF